MKFHHVRKATAVAALALVGWVGTVGSAQAAVYVGRWDPLFGGAFPDLSWSAEAQFFVPDSCLASDGQYDSGHPCIGFAALEGLVTFTDTTGVEAPETLGASSFNLANFTVAGGDLTGVTGLFSAVTPAGAFAGGGTYSFALGLGGLASTLLSKTPANTGTDCNFANPGTCGQSSAPAQIQGGGFVLVSAVPEPESYAMLLAGLGLIGFLRRRQR